MWLRNLLIFGVLATGAFAVVMVYREWLLVRQLQALVQITKRWAAGDFGARSRLAGLGGQLGQLSRAFNDMVESLESHLLERKQAERRERQRLGELDRAYHQLQQAQAQLVQAEKLAAIGRMASGIAHEVQNPLGILLQGVSFFERADKPTPEKTAEVLRLMEDAVTRADTIIQGLLTFARPASLKLTAGNLHEVINASLALVEKQLTLKNINLVKAFMDSPPPVMLDPNQLQQVFINLFTNAQHAMEKGGRLTIRTSTRKLTELQVGIGRRVTDRLKLGEEVLVCEVQDTGCGIPKEKLGRIFEPFFTTKPPGEGTGLGLAIVHGIVENHRGLIVVDSIEGHGTTLTIMLPVAEAAG